MPVQVAQLNIVVAADTTQANAQLQAINTAFATMATSAAAAVQPAVAGEQELASAISAVVLAVREQTTVIQEGASAMSASTSQMTSSVNGVAAGVNNVASATNNVGQIGSRAAGQLSMGFAAAGVSLGPVGAGLNAAGYALSSIPAKASAATVAVGGLAAAMTLVGSIALNVGSKIEQSNAVLQNSVQNLGKSYDDFSDQVDHARAYGESLGLTEDKVNSAMAQLITVTGNGDAALRGFNAATDLAAHGNKPFADALRTTVLALEGSGRGLRTYGVNLTLVVHPVENLKKALDALHSAMQKQQESLDALHAAQQKYNDMLTIAAEKHDAVAVAVENQNRAVQSLDDLYAKFAADDAVPKLTREEEATRSYTDAVEHLGDVLAKQHAEELAPKIDHVADATVKLAEAQARLHEVMDRKAKATMVTPEELLKLANASDKVFESQMRLAVAQGGDIAAAQSQLRASVDAQRAALDAQAEKQHAAIADTSSLISAQNAVRSSTRDLQNAQRTAYLESIGQTPRQIEQQIQLRDAYQAVQDGVTKVAFARRQDAAEDVKTQLDRAVQIRSAQQQIADAGLGVRDAEAAVHAQLLHQREARDQLTLAQDRYAAATGKVGDEVKKVLAAEFVLAHQQETTLKAIEGAVGGAGKAKSDNWLGAIQEGLATIQDRLGTSGIGGLLAGAGGLAGLFIMAKGFSGISGAIAGLSSAAAAAAPEAGALAVGVEEVGAAAGGTALAAVGWPLVIAAGIATAGVMIYHHWDEISDKWVQANDWLEEKSKAAWHNIQTGIADDARSIGGHVSSMWHTTEDAFNDGRNQISDAASTGWSAVSDTFGFGSDDVEGTVTRMGPKLGAAAHRSVSAMGKSTENAWDTIIKPLFGGRIGALMNDVNSNANQRGWNTVGGNISAGIANGITARSGLMGIALGVALGNAHVAANRQIQAWSPSRLFATVGHNIADGVALGIVEHSEAPVKALQKLSGAMSGSMAGAGRSGAAGNMLNASAGLGVSGGGVFNQYTIHVAGSVVSEGDLAERLRDRMISNGRGQGGDYFGGQA